ncbi:hypothetical protein KNU71_gp144 [Streptomyces phage Braelyn]|uniref:DUF6915 domain-containing protein n=1 Tax=Streptomyces phage Braelyn TaxID=2593356 RepID=A0A514U1Z0_9CAUD|nr:hypothetical protein KNU71_gp144 [Streptomyces phage Braelyn]QDK02974.1 hypothetical protein SEA_BRAELYN_129 [Streptomyces phage Braelyn]WNM73000.1 hypothetical protein SEA_PERSIMMON_128 [Streptomyces phage Persimmon]
MSNSFYHARSSARKWGGVPEDYIAIHEWIDASKAHFGDARHRALRHHTEGCWEAERVFGLTITVKKERTGVEVRVPVREIAEQHIFEDLGWIPSLGDWLKNMELKEWMGGKVKKTVSRTDVLKGNK